MHRYRIIVFVCLLATLLAYGGLLLAVTKGKKDTSANKKQVVLKVGTVAPDQTPWTRLIVELENEALKASGNRLSFKNGFGASFGGEQELVRQCQNGTLAMIGVSTTIVANLVPEINILEMPYLFDSYDEAYYIIDNILDAEISPLLSKHGLMIILWTGNGFKNMATVGRPVASLKAAKGLLMRTQQSDVYRTIFESLGMRVFKLNVREVARGLQSGMIDGFDNTPLFTYSSGLHLYIKYYTLSKHTFQPVLLLFSKKVYNSLPIDIRDVFWKNHAQLSRESRLKIRNSQFEFLRKLESSGVSVVKLDAKQRTEFVDRTKVVYESAEKLLGKNGARLLDKVQKTLKARRKNN